MLTFKAISQLEVELGFRAVSMCACRLHQCTPHEMDEGKVQQNNGQNQLAAVLNSDPEDLRMIKRRKRRRQQKEDESIFAKCGLLQLENTTRDELEKEISNSKVYDHDGIIALNKPAGVPVTGTSQDRGNIADILPQVAESIGKPAAEIAKAADRYSSGLLLLGECKQTATALNDTFLKARRRNQLIRKYWALTVGIPSPVQGTIDIPIGSEKIGDHTLMLPRRHASKGNFEHKDVVPCRTDYQLLSANQDLNCSLLELQPLKLQKLQFQVHLSNKLCSILGDRLYSNQIQDILGVPVLVDPHQAAIGTQNIPAAIQKALGLRAWHMARLPLFLHWYQVTLPSWRNKKDVSIKAAPPGYFIEALQRLGLYSQEVQENIMNDGV
ncbi:mitochondrial mRNA pseudouridine synthase Rpusd3-like [Patiria miniata]|uniref:Pseudouridine synthase RsuA/RluA-like domain-containing protein n=1 Tax=Patiria miniata TaxID=46514 RepID=A0A914AD38_PATMI|nr:mitochondrial mRNA pseudouridine synthase Rpusd3-like [Patiria miniata]